MQARLVLARKLPAFLFMAAVVMASFVYGVLVGKYKLFPYSAMSDGWKTLQVLTGVYTPRNFIDFVDIPPKNAATHRIRFLNGGTLGGSVLWYGGRFQFLEHCPDWGCIAVEFAADGSPVHAYPFRPGALEKAWSAGASDNYSYETSPSFRFYRDAEPIGIHPMPNGDLLVIFHLNHAHPYAGGIARIDRDGHPIWFRRDYSHHWGHMEDDGSIIVPAMLLGESRVPIVEDIAKRLGCDTGKPYASTLNFIDEDGRLLKRINVLDALLDSSYAPTLQFALGSAEHCDAVHLNFVDRLRNDAGGAWGMAPGDIVVSLRNLSAFALLDGQSGRVKRLVRGSFHHQHSVQHLEGSKFLMFDNLGGGFDRSANHGYASRLLVVNLADGRETPLFPNDRTPEHLKGLVSHTRGMVDISANRRRAIVTIPREGWPSRSISPAEKFWPPSSRCTTSPASISCRRNVSTKPC